MRKGAGGLAGLQAAVQGGTAVHRGVAVQGIQGGGSERRESAGLGGQARDSHESSRSKRP